MVAEVVMAVVVGAVMVVVEVGEVVELVVITPPRKKIISQHKYPGPTSCCYI